MSQIEVMLILKELGPCTRQQIMTRAKEKFPTLKLWTYVSVRLHRMKKHGLVDKDKDGKWIIIDDSILRERNVYQ